MAESPFEIGRCAEMAHTRLLQDADAERQLAGTNHDALRRVAERHGTLSVPQVAAALERLRKSQRSSEEGNG